MRQESYGPNQIAHDCTWYYNYVYGKDRLPACFIVSLHAAYGHMPLHIPSGEHQWRALQTGQIHSSSPAFVLARVTKVNLRRYAFVLNDCHWRLIAQNSKADFKAGFPSLQHVVLCVLPRPQDSTVTVCRSSFVVQVTPVWRLKGTTALDIPRSTARPGFSTPNPPVPRTETETSQKSNP